MSNAAFKTALENMTVSGVLVHKGYPPASIQPSDLPLAFIELPSAGLGDYIVSCIDNNKTRSMRYIICLEAAGLGTQEANYDLIAGAMDNLEDSLDTALSTTANFYTYEMAAGTYTVAGTDYWAIITTVSIRSV